eukprot:2583309-Pyramimonas_sp.AAC.1
MAEPSKPKKPRAPWRQAGRFLARGSTVLSKTAEYAVVERAEEMGAGEEAERGAPAFPSPRSRGLPKTTGACLL